VIFDEGGSRKGTLDTAAPVTLSETDGIGSAIVGEGVVNGDRLSAANEFEERANAEVDGGRRNM
jgi:hypothetical protein